MDNQDTRIISTGGECPACKSNALTQQVLVYHDRFSSDEMLIFTSTCASCNFKSTHAEPIRGGKFSGARRYELRVDSTEDLYSKVFRAPTASISIPELDISLEPGVAGDMFVTNIEGLLLKFKEKCEFLLENDPREEFSEIYKTIIKQIDDCISGDLKFHVILQDPHGFSYIFPARENNLVMIRNEEIEKERSSGENFETK